MNLDRFMLTLFHIFVDRRKIRFLFQVFVQIMKSTVCATCVVGGPGG